MKERSRLSILLIFCGRFILIGALCFFVWWWKVLPLYAMALGQLSGITINLFTDPPIEALNVESDPDAVLTTETSLVYTVGTHELTFPVGFLINSPITYLALVLATVGISLKRRLIILAGGLAFFFVGQVAYVTCFYLFAEQFQRWNEFATAFGQFWLTLPFMMWIVLAYWDRVLRLFQDESEETPG